VFLLLGGEMNLIALKYVLKSLKQLCFEITNFVTGNTYNSEDMMSIETSITFNHKVIEMYPQAEELIAA